MTEKTKIKNRERERLNKGKILQDRIDKAIEILEKDENKVPIEVILNNVEKALDILKGE